MEYQNIIRGTFLSRPNRFIAMVAIGGQEAVCHVKNTGRCAELLRPGATVYLEKSANPARKTAYDLVAVEKGSLLINMDAQAPNRVFAQWAAAGKFLPDVQVIHPEYRYGGSRLDFALTTPRGLHLVEVKGVTLEENGHARFPDAPTERGVKHLKHLACAAAQGYLCYAIFVIQMSGIKGFSPNWSTHPAFGEALLQAKDAGVIPLAFETQVQPQRVELAGPVMIDYRKGRKEPC